MKQRLAFNIALVISLLYLPWWAGALIVTSACFLVPNFYEAVIYGILMDALYGTTYGFHGHYYLGTLFTAIVLFIASALRDRLAW